MVRKVLIMSGHIPCVRGSLNLVSKRGLRGLHTDVFRVNDSVIKIKRWRKCTVQVAVTHHKYLRRIREKLNFLPKYYGTIIATVNEGEKRRLATISFYDYVEPLSFLSLNELEGLFSILGEAQGKGYFLDLKPSNFGKRDGKILYLDDYGIGRTPIPPDIVESFDKLKEKFNAFWR